MRFSSVTVGLSVLLLVSVLLCSSADGTPAIDKSRRYVDEVHARGLEATARALGKRQAWRNAEKEAEKMARENAKSHIKVAEKWRKRDNEEFYDDIIGFF
jgi:hypothetical protein